MRITILSEKLNQALGVVSKGVASRPQLPVLANVLMRTVIGLVEMLSTDLEISFRIKVGAKVTKEGEVSVSGRVLSELVATLPVGPVDLIVEKDNLEIVADGIKSKISGMASGEYPVIPGFSGKPDVEIGVDELVKEVSRVGLSAAKDDARPVLTGILWKFEENGVKLVATDGYRLSVGGLKLRGGLKKKQEKLILPARALLELVRIGEKAQEELVAVKFEPEKQQVVFRVGEVEVVSRLLAGEFPPFEQIMPSTHTTKVAVSRQELTEAVRRASIFARESANIVKLSVISDQSSGQLTVSANSSQVGSSESVVSAEVEGDSFEVAFNGRYLLDYLGVAQGEKVVIESEGGLKPGVLKEEGSDWVHVIMPVRVQG